MVPPGTKYDTTGVSPLLRLPVADVIEATPPGGPPPAGAGRVAADKVPCTPVASGISGRSPATSEHGAKDVAEPQVPITWWEACPVEAPSVRVEPEIVQVSQFAPAAVHEVAPGAGGGKTPLWARPSWANQPTRMTHNGNHPMLLETCLSAFVMIAAPYSLAWRQYRLNSASDLNPAFWHSAATALLNASAAAASSLVNWRPRGGAFFSSIKHLNWSVVRC